MNLFEHDPLIAGVKGLVFVGDDVLVYRRDNNTDRYPFYVDVAGGAAEPGETPFETFKREVKEEFGLDVAREDIVYSKRYDAIYEKDMFVWFVVAKLPASLKDKIVFGDEGLEYFLMPIEKYIKLKDGWPTYQQRAAEYLASLGQAA